jgi:hypothetical protein
MSRLSARHVLIYCLPGALKVAMIRGLVWGVAIGSRWRLQESKRCRRHAREHIIGMVVDIGFGGREPGGAGLILGMRIARCWGFAT